jgi:peptidoglycan/LPS O-acetylase OafA/YrhL
MGQPAASAISERPLVAPSRRTSAARDTATQPSVTLRYQPALDGIRAIAVVAVMVCHAFPTVAGGGYGVDVFFCLSGFLITSLLLDEWRATGGVRLSYFWARRGLRLLPALFVMVAAVGLYAAFVAPAALRRETLGAIPSVLFYFANWRRAVGHRSLGFLGPTWSLSVEEQFYVVWPLVALVVLRQCRRPLPWLLGIAGAGIVSALVERLMIFGLSPNTNPLRLNGADTRADQLLAGCALAAACWGLSERGRAVLRRGLALLFVPALALFAAVVRFTPEKLPRSVVLDAGMLTLVAAASTVVVGHVALNAGGRAARVLGVGPLAGIGRISYGLYLWHFAVFWIVAVHLHLTDTTLRVVCIFPAALAAALLSRIAVERPLLRLKDRLRPKPLPPAVVPIPRRRPLQAARRPARGYVGVSAG